MDASSTMPVAIITGAFSLAGIVVSTLGLWLNGRRERARADAEQQARADAEEREKQRAAEAAEKAAEAARLRANTEHWSNLVRRLESDIRRITAERDEALEARDAAVGQCESKTARLQQIEDMLAARTRELRLAERELDRLRARTGGKAET